MTLESQVSRSLRDHGATKAEQTGPAADLRYHLRRGRLRRDRDGPARGHDRLLGRVPSRRAGRRPSGRTTPSSGCARRPPTCWRSASARAGSWFGQQSRSRRSLSPLRKCRSRSRADAAWLGLGSNVATASPTCVRQRPTRRAEALAWKPVPRCTTEPVGEVLDEPTSSNAAVRVETTLSPLELLESARRSGGWAGSRPRHGPRPIDVDLLLVEEVQLDQRLVISTPRRSRSAGSCWCLCSTTS